MKVFRFTFGVLVLLCSLYACEDARRVSLTESSSVNMMTDLIAGEEVVGETAETAGEVLGGETAIDVSQLQDLVPGPPVWSRLTQSQYRNMVSDILGLDSSDLDLEPDTNPYLFTSIGSGSSSVSAFGVELYAEAAFILAERYFASDMNVQLTTGCLPNTVDDGCADQLIRTLGLRLYRRPLSESEFGRWQALAQLSATSRRQEDQLKGLENVLAAMLQSPFVLYRLEQGMASLDDEIHHYTDLELASRLAFTLQDSAPDQELLNLALEGRLKENNVLEAQIDRLLNTERAKASINAFFAQYLDLSRLKRVERDPSVYEGFTPSLLNAMETEVRLLVNDLVYRRDTDIRLLFSEKKAYLNQTLADHYGISLEQGSPIIFESLALPEDTVRVGFLGTAAFLTMNAHPTETSPTLRGKYIRERLLCQEVPPPPDDIDLNLEPETGEASTLRERLERHREDPACAGCHSFIDPPGFLFERFDSVGRYRESVNGITLDASGDLDGVPMSNLGDLAQHLAQDSRLSTCMVRQVYRFALGRLEEEGEESEILRLHEKFRAQGFRFKALIKALLMSDGFRQVGPSTELNNDNSFNSDE